MTLLRKNLWLLYILLVLLSVLGFSFVLHQGWSNSVDKSTQQQQHLAVLVSKTTHSVFTNLEITLDIIGQSLIEDNTYPDHAKTNQLLSKSLTLNPYLAGFGLATPDGKITFVSNNLDTSQLPNLRENNQTAGSFIHALNSDKMVLGRTYFMSAANTWLIPIRKAIRDEKGNVLAVMTAGLKLGDSNDFLGSDLHLGEHSELTMIREFDHYVQYRSPQREGEYDFHQPISNQLFALAEQQAKQLYGLDIDAVKSTGKAVSFDLTIKGEKMSISAIYEPRYELWVLAETPKKQFYSDFWDSLATYILVFALLQIAIFFFFHSAANAEEKKQKLLLEQATHDLLTGLPNRNFLHSRSAYWFENPDHAFSILYLDMDHFKNVNDSLGHASGDKVLRQLADRLRKHLPEKSDLIRYGGDEFIIITPNIQEREIQSSADKIIHEVSQPYLVQGVRFNLGASIGVAHYPENGNNLDDLLRAADIAMYEAKKRRNCVRFFDKNMQSEYLERMEIEQQLRQALDHDEIYMVYQPQIDTQGKIFGVEALVRWENAHLGFVPPDRFIPVAESSGLMPSLGKFIIERCFADMNSLQNKLGYDLHLSINISVMQLMQDNFLVQLEQAMTELTFSHKLLYLEITENLFIEDLELVLPLLEKIHAMGIQISMDDFGTGYSSLSMLRKLPVDELKIDKSFIDNILLEDAAQNMIKSIIAIGKNYHMAVIAEGVESQEQADLLCELGCDRFQGYLFAKPMSLGALRELLLEPVSEKQSLIR